MPEKNSASYKALPRLGERLGSIAARVPLGSSVADIGSDHGLLPIYLALAKTARSVVAIEKGSIERAGLNSRRYGVEIDLRQGSGLRPLALGEAEVLVLAGLGGQTITDVLCERPEIVRDASLLLLQPMRDLPQTRRWLEDSRMELVGECLVKEGVHLYSVMSVLPARFLPKAWDARETEFRHEAPTVLFSNPNDLVAEFIGRRLTIRRHILQSLERGSRSVPGFHYDTVFRLERVLAQKGVTP